MKIVMSSDGAGWALDNISNGIIKYNPHIHFERIDIHPRAVDASLMKIQKIIREENIDAWHYQYWRSALQLMDVYPEVKQIPSILTHHNHYCFEKSDWKNFAYNTCQTVYGTDKLHEMGVKAIHIPHGIDLDRYAYIKEHKGTKIGYIGRVMAHKNLAKICAAAKILGYKVIGSGYIEKKDYFDTVDKSVLEFYGGYGRLEMNAAFHKDRIYDEMACFVMYSTEEKETGTLPLLEAMAKGVPVLATEQGSARDLIKHGENGLIFTEETFEHELTKIMKDKRLREKLRKNAWETIKNYSEERVAKEHEKLYYKTIFGKQSVVSVIIPTFNRADVLAQCLLSIEKDNYQAKEIIVADDNSTDFTSKIVMECRKHFKTPIKYINTRNEGYGLAQARNMAAVESIGDILLFLDDRYIIEPGVLTKVVNTCLPQTWSFGNKVIKGKLANKKGFIENFAWINRNEFFKAGMFNERFTMYGGLSQETRERFSYQGFGFNFVNDAIAKEIISSSSKHNKRNEVWKAKHLIYKING